ncbi:MAG: oligosaccharide flippase family protein [Lachnospiraceae bacterium]|nr:oligosaccharide flippase family protein [Lachnospiraceae bacterium]
MIKFLRKYRDMPVTVKASLWFVVCGFLQKGISLLTTPIFSRLLTTEEYGVVSIFLTWNNIIIIIATLNLAAGVYLRGLIKYSNDRDNFTASLQSLFVVCTGIVFLIYIIFRNYLNVLFDLPTKYVCVMFADILVCTAFQFWSARQRVEYQYTKLVALTLANALLKPTLGILFILFFEDNVSARIYSMVLADSITFGYLFASIFAHKGGKFSVKYWKYALNYNIPLVPHYLSQIVLNQADRVMINSLCGSSDAGIYSLAYSAAAVMTIFNQSILNSFNPWMYQSIKERKYKDIKTNSLYLLILVAALNLLLIFFAPEAISILAPKDYYQAIWVIPPVSMSVYFTFMYSLFANFEFYYEKTKFMMIASVFGAVLNIILNYFFVSAFGFLAAGYTTLVCYLCYCIAHYIVMKRILKSEENGINVYNIKSMLLISTLFVAAGFGIMLLYNHSYVRYAIFGIMVIILIAYRRKIWHLICTIREIKK